MQGAAAEPLQAWVDYFRDLGIHDFYRRGEGVFAAGGAAQEAEVGPASASHAPVESYVAMPELEAPVTAIAGESIVRGFDGA
jgi:hypothetical protein